MDFPLLSTFWKIFKLSMGRRLFHCPCGPLDWLVHFGKVFDEEFVEMWLFCMDRDERLWTDLRDRFS